MRWLCLFYLVPVLQSSLFGATAKLAKTITVSPDAVVEFAAISPKGTFIAGACHDGRLRLWTFPGGELRQAFDLQDQRISTMTFSNDGTLLAVGGNRGAVKIWTIPAGKLKVEWKAGEPVRALAISPDKTLLAVARYESPAQLWDLDVGRVITNLPAKFSGSRALDFSLDGKWLASADEDTEIRIYESHTGALRATASDLLLETFAITFSADSKYLYAGGGDKTISAIDLSTGKVVRSFLKQSFVVGQLHRSPDGKSLLAVYFDEISFANPAPAMVWDVGTEVVRDTFSQPEGTFNGSGFLSDGQALVTSSDGPKLQVWWAR